jgi:hypothetical protein
MTFILAFLSTVNEMQNYLIYFSFLLFFFKKKKKVSGRVVCRLVVQLAQDLGFGQQHV